MSRVLTVDGSVKIGAYRFPDRKKPCLCVEKGNTCTVYGSFIDTDRANEFMNELATLPGYSILLMNCVSLSARTPPSHFSSLRARKPIAGIIPI